jgi:hypothetical protein
VSCCAPVLSFLDAASFCGTIPKSERPVVAMDARLQPGFCLPLASTFSQFAAMFSAMNVPVPPMRMDRNVGECQPHCFFGDLNDAPCPLFTSHGASIMMHC